MTHQDELQMEKFAIASALNIEHIEADIENA